MTVGTHKGVAKPEAFADVLSRTCTSGVAGLGWLVESGWWTALEQTVCSCNLAGITSTGVTISETLDNDYKIQKAIIFINNMTNY